ncbi:MAG: HAD family phosphatase [Saprospiraceae bacterium]|nr:HAD family phosphatase [Candidatus Vicinibacter affinis]
MIPTKPKALIFDFGNVLLNLNEDLSWEGFKAIMDPSLTTDIFEMVFHPFERGDISEDSFFNRLQRRSYHVHDGAEYVKIWNAMLLDFPPHRFEFLKSLRKEYKLYLLSNTNITHLRKVRKKIELENNNIDFESYFDTVYFSHELHMRKPETRIYLEVLQRTGLNHADCLFIDDKIENVEAARSIGIPSYHHNPDEDIAYIFDKVLAEAHV